MACDVLVRKAHPWKRIYEGKAADEIGPNVDIPVEFAMTMGWGKIKQGQSLVGVGMTTDRRDMGWSGFFGRKQGIDPDA